MYHNTNRAQTAKSITGLNDCNWHMFMHPLPYVQVPLCLVSLIDSDRQWTSSAQGARALELGLQCNDLDRSKSFCAWSLLPRHAEILLIEDMLLTPGALAWRLSMLSVMLHVANIRHAIRATPMWSRHGVSLLIEDMLLFLMCCCLGTFPSLHPSYSVCQGNV